MSWVAVGEREERYLYIPTKSSHYKHVRSTDMLLLPTLNKLYMLTCPFLISVQKIITTDNGQSYRPRLPREEVARVTCHSQVGAHKVSTTGRHQYYQLG